MSTFNKFYRENPIWSVVLARNQSVTYYLSGLTYKLTYWLLTNKSLFLISKAHYRASHILPSTQITFLANKIYSVFLVTKEFYNFEFYDCTEEKKCIKSVGMGCKLHSKHFSDCPKFFFCFTFTHNRGLRRWLRTDNETSISYISSYVQKLSFVF